VCVNTKVIYVNSGVEASGSDSIIRIGLVFGKEQKGFWAPKSICEIGINTQIRLVEWVPWEEQNLLGQAG